MRIISIIYRHIVPIPEASFGGIAFFLLSKANAVELAKVFQLCPEASVWDIDKILVIRLAQLAISLERYIVAANEFADFMLYAVIYYPFGCLGDVIIDSVIPLAQ